MKLRVSWFGLMFGILAACGSDSPAAVAAAGGGGTLPAAGTTATGSGGAPGAAGTGAAGTTQTTAGTGASAAGNPAAPVTCGTATCLPAPPNPGLSKTPPVACCANAATNECGNSVAGTCTPPPPLAPNCMFSFSTARTCCITATNICGIDASAYGMGCLDVSASVGGLKMSCDGTGAAAGGGATAGASGAAAGSGGATAGAGGARAGAGGV